MSDKAALSAAICAAPGEDTPRLALADWLAEHGGEAGAVRAEFIRLQVESHRLAPPLPLRHTHPALLEPPTTVHFRAPGAPPRRKPDRLVGRRKKTRERVAALEAQLEALWGLHGGRVLFGLTADDCLLSPVVQIPAWSADLHVPQDDTRRVIGRVLNERDMLHGSRRGFLGAIACTSTLWEAEAARLLARFPIEEVQFLNIPARNLDHYREQWPTVQFNRRR